MARLGPHLPAHSVLAGGAVVHPGDLRPVPAQGLHQRAEMARQPPVRDRLFLRPGELRGGAHQRPVLAVDRAHVLFRQRGGGGRARGRLRARHAGEPVHALQEVLHHHVPDPDDDCADRGRVQFLDDLHRQRPAQPAAGAFSGAVRHRSAHPLAVRPGGGAARHHHRRHLAVDLADLPDLPVRLLGAAPPADRRRPRHGRYPLADLLARAATTAQARHRDRGDHPLDGGAEDVRPGGTAHIRGAGHLHADRCLFPVGAGLGVQQVQLRGGRLGAAADHVLRADLRRHLSPDPAAQYGRGEGLNVALKAGLTPEQARARRVRRERGRHTLRHGILLAWTFFIAFPIFWMVSTSFKDSGEWVAWRPDWLPARPTLPNYAQIFAFRSIDPSLSRQAAEQAFSIWKGLGDALLVCTTAALLALLLGAALAYSISRFQVGGRYFRHTILTIRMIPPIVVAIAFLTYYALLTRYPTSAVLGARISLFDTYIGLMLIYAATTLPFVIWMMLPFVDEVPYTFEHAARLLGASRITVIRRIVLPLVASGMVVTFLFVFSLSWAEFLLALTLTHREVTTLTVLLNKFQSASEGRLYGPQAAIGTMITIPVVVLGILIQKHLVKGFSFGTIRK